MLTRPLLDRPGVFWSLQAMLLTPLALFWMSVVTNSDSLSRLLFGPQHTPFRDLLPVLILPGTALLLGLVRLNRAFRYEPAFPKSQRNAILLAGGFVMLSNVVVFAYSISEALREGRQYSAR